MSHIPVLLNEMISALKPADGEVYVDGTFGAGGYSKALLEAARCTVYAIDRDPSVAELAASLAQSFPGRFFYILGGFGDMVELLASHGVASVDGIVLDIGVSSMQIDEAERGFSFRFDGPLDMRMGRHGRSAADLVNEAEEATLADIFYDYGEERQSRRIARAIVAARDLAPIETTDRLAEIVRRAIGGKPNPHAIDPATRTFQALRIAVNDELGELVEALAAAEAVLKPGGKLIVVTFHSLEDRIVKQFFTHRSGRGEAPSRRLPGEAAPKPPTFILTGKQPLTPSEAEVAANPRARSAKLRHGVRTSAAARPIEPELAALARLPQRAVKGR